MSTNLQEQITGYIRTVNVADGVVLCNVEQKNQPSTTYKNVPLLRPLNEQVSVPETGTEVILLRMSNGDYVIVGTITGSYDKQDTESDIETGANNGHGSVSFVFGPRDGVSEPERFEIEYGSNGYHIDADVDSDITLKAGQNVSVEANGDISLSASGDIYIDEGGSTKAVATEDHTHTFNYDGGGKNSGTKSGTTDKPDDTTNVEME